MLYSSVFLVSVCDISSIVTFGLSLRVSTSLSSETIDSGLRSHLSKSYRILGSSIGLSILKDVRRPVNRAIFRYFLAHSIYHLIFLNTLFYNLFFHVSLPHIV